MSDRQFKRLAERFRGVASGRELEATIRDGGLLVRELLGTGKIAAEHLIELASATHTADPMAADFALWTLWVFTAETIYPRAYAPRMTPAGDGCYAGVTDPDDYRQRAENYAAVALKIADMLEPAAADPWAAHYEEMKADGAKDREIAKAWQRLNPEDCRDIEQLMRKCQNYRAKRNREAKTRPS